MVVSKIYAFELHIFVALLHYNADRIHVNTTAYVIHCMHVFGNADGSTNAWSYFLIINYFLKPLLNNLFDRFCSVMGD